MIQRFDDMARERDALYQATMPRGDFAEALFHDRTMSEWMKTEDISMIWRNFQWCKAALLPLAIRALKREEVKPG